MKTFLKKYYLLFLAIFLLVFLFSFKDSIKAQVQCQLAGFGDVNCDNKVNILDLSILLANFGRTAVPRSTPTPAPSPTNTPVPPTPTRTPTPVPATPTPTPSGNRLSNVRSWLYQLNSYNTSQLTNPANSFDLAVIDLASDGSSNYFIQAQINSFKVNGRIVLAYFEIGAIENYRPEWDWVTNNANDLKLGPVSGWPSEQYVKYWDDRWWNNVVKGRVDQALRAGFDGAYLDMIVTYEEIPANSAGTNRTDLAKKMVDLIARLSTYAKQGSPYANPNFYVFPQNSPELGNGFINSTYDTIYRNAIDGLGMEEMYVMATNSPCTASWCQENRNNALAINNAGKLVLSIDYATSTTYIQSAYTQARTAGFVPYVSVQALDKCYLSQHGPNYTTLQTCN